jgi:catechol 2,3-dioxygenase-like lactoylglutathione lyase family enzyme
MADAKSPADSFLGLRHVAINVRDVRKSVDFYTKVMGMSVEWEPDPDNVYLTSGGDNLAIHRLTEPDKVGPIQTIDHIGFVVRTPADVDLWADRLRHFRVTLVKEPKTHRDGARSFYFRDPDGLLVQLIYHPPISNRARE